MLASGKYFKQLDGDDFFNPVTLPAYIDLLNSLDVDLVITPYIEFDSLSSTILRKYPVNSEGYCSLEEADERSRKVMHSCTVRTEMLRRYDVKVLERCFFTDSEFYIKGISRVRKAYLSGLNVYCYRQNVEGQSVSLKGLRAHLNDVSKSTASIVDYYVKGKSSWSTDRERLLSRHVGLALAFKYLTLLRLGLREQAIEYDAYVKSDYPAELYNSVPKWIRLARLFDFHGIFLIDRQRDNFRNIKRLIHSSIEKVESISHQN